MAAFAFHPLVRLLRRQIERCRETSCDAEVVAAGIVRPREYAGLLVDVHAPARFPMPAVAAGMSARSVTLKQRVETVARFADARPASRRRGGAVLASGLAFFSLAIACGSDAVDDSGQVTSWRFEKLWELNSVTAEFMAANTLRAIHVAADADGNVYLLNRQAIKVFATSPGGRRTAPRGS